MKELILTVSTLGMCGSHERIDFNRGRYGSLEKTEFNSVAFNSFYFGRVESKGVAVLKELILTVSTLERCGSLERTILNSFYFGNVVILTVSSL